MFNEGAILKVQSRACQQRSSPERVSCYLLDYIAKLSIKIGMPAKLSLSAVEINYFKLKVDLINYYRINLIVSYRVNLIVNYRVNLIINHGINLIVNFRPIHNCKRSVKRIVYYRVNRILKHVVVW